MVCCAGPSFSLQLNISNIYSIDHLKKSNTILKPVFRFVHSQLEMLYFSGFWFFVLLRIQEYETA